MPSHTVASALALMYLNGGEPWDFPKWKELTGVQHGLFPEDSARLPRGLTRRDADFVVSYFDQYQKRLKDDENEIIKFATASRSNGQQIPGRGIWSHFVNEQWKKSKIHARITDVLREEKLHPLDLAMEAQARNNQSSGEISWPPGNIYIPLVVDAVALDLFGDEALNENGRLSLQLRQTTQHLIQRTWKVLHNQLNRSKASLLRLEKAALEAFDGIDSGNTTVGAIKGACVKLSRWKQVAILFQNSQTVTLIEEKEAILSELMSELGLKVGSRSGQGKQKSRLKNSTTQALRQLAQQDVRDILCLYEELFTCPAVQDSINLQEQHSALSFQFGSLVADSDPGIEMEATMPPNVLASNLDFKDGLPILFNRYRHRGGLLSWDPDNASLFEPANAQLNPDMSPIALHWHQLAGIHGVIRMIFKSKPTDQHTWGFLVADEVGLGKTYQAGAFIAFLTDIVLRQSSNKALPPIIKTNPYLRGKETVPNLPHLIIVPGTLVTQWEVELQAILDGRMFNILLYGGGKGINKDFWAEDGPYHTSTRSGANLIIIAAHSAVQRDFAMLFSWIKPKAEDLPWANPRVLGSFEKLAPTTLYGRDYLSVTLDEAHMFRNVGARHSSVLLLLERAVVRNIMTATPLQTSTKDVAGMGRLAGIPFFFTQLALEEEKGDATSLRRAKNVVLEDPTVQDPDVALLQCQMAIAHRMQKQFEGLVLRRTIDSKNWEGKSLINIPPYEEIRLVLKLTAREMDIITELADDIRDSVSTTNGALAIVSRTFYIEHRMSVGYARRSLTDLIPTFKTLEEWEVLKSTKMDTAARLCRHLLSRDDAPAIAVEDGAMIFPPPLQEGKIHQTVKIIIYQEFPSLGGLLRNILNLYDIHHQYIDGQMSYHQRAGIVKEFCESDRCRVLIVSSVGSVGLNLSVASVIIFLDQPWSAQDERQIRGRAHRQPQDKVVKCYHLLADETADIVLASMASGKKTMFDAFLEKDSGKEMYDLLSGKTVVGANEDAYDSDIEVKEAKREKVSAQTKAAAAATRKAEKAAQNEARKAEKEREREEKKAEKAKKQQAEKAKKEQVEKAKKEQAERAKKERAEKVKKEQAERAKKEQEKKAKKEQEKKAKQEAESGGRRNKKPKSVKGKPKVTSKETVDDSDVPGDEVEEQTKADTTKPVPDHNQTTDADTTDGGGLTDGNDMLTDDGLGDLSMDMSTGVSRETSPSSKVDDEGDQSMSPRSSSQPQTTGGGPSTPPPQTPPQVGVRRGRRDNTDSPKNGADLKRPRLDLSMYNSYPACDDGASNPMDVDSLGQGSPQEQQGEEDERGEVDEPIGLDAQPPMTTASQDPPPQAPPEEPTPNPLPDAAEPTGDNQITKTNQSKHHAQRKPTPNKSLAVGLETRRSPAIMKPQVPSKNPRPPTERRTEFVETTNTASTGASGDKGGTRPGELLPPAEIQPSKNPNENEVRSQKKRAERPLDRPLKLKTAAQFAKLTEQAKSSQDESTSEKSSRRTPSIPDLRRPTTFGAHTGSLTPPSANLHARKPNKGKGKRL